MRKELFNMGNGDRLKISFLMILLILVTVFLVKGESAMTNDISLILQANKENYFIGDNVEFTYTFFNNGLQSVYVLPWGGHYATNWIAIYDDRDIKLQDLPLVVCELKFMPLKEEFIRIEPKQSYSIFVKGKIVKTTLSKFGLEKNEKIKGLFINFDNSAIYLKKSGSFKVKAFYQGMDEWSKKGKELYGLDNIFVGNIESKELRIIIKE